MAVSKEDKLIVPEHLGLILDGNRRWSKANGVSVDEGHRQGYENLKVISKAAFDMGVKYVSAYVFSTENWRRDPQEVKDIMSLSYWAFRNEVKAINKAGTRLRVLTARHKLSPKLLKAIEAAEQATKNNTNSTILLCLDYGGQQEIVDAVKKINDSNIDSKDITAELISANLYAPDVPPPDLIIRTSGEQRLSNFLTWQSVYSELMFEDKNWPDFSVKDLSLLLNKYSSLQRRYGK